MKLIGLISPNYSDDTMTEVYKILPEGVRIEGRALDVEHTRTANFTE